MTNTLTPKHTVLSEASAKRALKAAGLTFDALPLLKITDVAVRNLIDSGIEVRPGDVMQITRKSFTTGEEFYYRRVVL